MKTVPYALITLSLLIFPVGDVHSKVIVRNKKFCADLGGSIDFKFSHVNNKEYFTYKYSSGVALDSDVHFTGAYNIIPTTSVGSNLTLEIKFNPNFDYFGAGKVGVKRAYVFVAPQNIGRVEFGIDDTADNNMQISTNKKKFTVADGGVTGSWIHYANLHNYNQAKGLHAYYGSSINAFWVKPSLYSKYKWFKSPVISYYSPIISGIQVGISYVPGESDIGYDNLVAGGINYSNKLFDSISYSFSLTGEFAKAKPEDDLNKLSTWNAGFDLQYKNVIFLFSYGNIGKSGHISSHEAEYVNAGVAYHASKWKSALTYFGSNKGDNKLSSWGISWERVLLENTMYYTDFIAFDAKQPAVESNLGTVFLVGLKSSF